MALETYRQKRNFKSTREPKGRPVSKKLGNSFVIQKHAARRLHYDFRLEMDGVLKSWAVTRGPSLVAGEKRLAVHVEDHPLEYGSFEGTIPKGEYGGGTVIVWDRGRWRPIGDAHKAYKKGHLDFELDGEKLAGRWHLVRMRGKQADKHENWLLIKGDDDAARSAKSPDLLEERPESVKTGRVIKDVAGEEPGWSSKTGKIEREDIETTTSDLVRIKGAKKGEMADFVEPLLATLVSKAPTGQRWLHEIKFDGYRLQARVEAGRVKLRTRSGLDWTRRFGKEIGDGLRALPVASALIDGELVVEGDTGASDFSSLQADLSEGRMDRFVFYAFDLLYLDGYDLRSTKLVDRKAALQDIIPKDQGVIRFSEHFDQDGGLVLRHACRLSLEGVVSKVRDGPYRSGRGKSWVKSKCSQRQEFVVAGYVPSTASRKAIGSLVLGYYEGKKLRHAGRVGTGYTASVAEDLFKRLDPMRITPSPFSGRISAEDARQVRYVRPELVAEVEYRGWTADLHLRHASFRGLREDKEAREVVRETSAAPAAPAPKRTVKLTHPDRLYWPDAGVTKAGLADYYSEVWRRMAPFVVGRPLALVRCPDGVGKPCFFQKHAWQGMNSAIIEFQDPAEEEGERLLSINDFDGMVALAQAGVLEVHPWGSTVADIERPDIIIMDLDPGDQVAWEHVISAAENVRQRMKNVGLASFVKTSGGKGLHVVSPLKPKANWEAVKAFTKSVADQMASDEPDRFVSTVTKSKRHGKILVDYLRNGRGSTAVAPYSTRSRPGAPVSMPLAWNELAPGLGPTYFTVSNTPIRLQSLDTDPWADFRSAAVPLPISTKRRRRS